MTKRSDAPRRPHRCKGKHNQDDGGTRETVLLTEMDDQDRALIRAVRMWAASDGDKTTVGLLFGSDLGLVAPENMMTPLVTLIESMDEDGGPTIALREPSCGKTTPSERAIARMVAAMGQGDAATAQACASTLVSPERTRQVVANAFVLAAALADVRPHRAENTDRTTPRIPTDPVWC